MSFSSPRRNNISSQVVGSAKLCVQKGSHPRDVYYCIAVLLCVDAISAVNTKQQFQLQDGVTDRAEEIGKGGCALPALTAAPLSACEKGFTPPTKSFCIHPPTQHEAPSPLISWSTYVCGGLYHHRCGFTLHFT